MQRQHQWEERRKDRTVEKADGRESRRQEEEEDGRGSGTVVPAGNVESKERLRCALFCLSLILSSNSHPYHVLCKDNHI